MSNKQTLLADRAMRDAARAVVKRSVAQVKGEASGQPLASRAVAMGADYARTIGEGALDLAHENRKPLIGGALALATGLAAWLFRHEIADLVAGFSGPQGDAGDHDDA